jgi:uncharacterized protein YecE (DUF72 family)
MWANRDWVGRYLPADTRPGEELLAYRRWCNAVEGNTTFYGVPSARTVERWRAQTPPTFRFVFKLPRTITHERRLRDGGDELAAFCARVAPLGERLGPTSVQLPASFSPGELDVLDRFLVTLPRDRPWAVEVRHPAFSDGGPEERALNDLLHGHGVDRILLDSRALFAGPADTAEEQETKRRKPRLPVRPVATAHHPVVRFVGQTHVGPNAPFWAPWAAKVAAWLGQGREPFFFLHTPDNVVALDLARRFRGDVAVHADGLPPLGTDQPTPDGDAAGGPPSAPAAAEPTLW